MRVSQIQRAVGMATIARTPGPGRGAGSRTGRDCCNKDKSSKHGESGVTYQNCGKLSLSSSNRNSSWISRSLSRGFLPNLWATWGVFLRDIVGRVDLCLVEELSVTVTAFLTSVVEVLAEPWPDFLRW